MNPSSDVPRKAGLRTRAWNALVDASPVLAKELLVTARTPVFVGSMIVAPLLLGALVLLVWGGMSHRPNLMAARELFPVYFTGLSIVLGSVGATLGSTVVAQEREAGALEALKFSSLSPRRIVLGKFAAVVLAEGVVVACTLPLLAFILALGVSVGEAAVAMAIALSCGVMTASTGIATSAHVPNTRRSLFISLLAASAVGIGVVIWVAVGSDLGPSYGLRAVARVYFEAPIDGTYIAVLWVVPAYVLTTLLWLGYAAATSGLMDRSEDRILPLKRWTVGALGLGMMALFLCMCTPGTRSRDAVAGGSMIATALLAFALLIAFVDEPVHPTRRMQLHPRTLLVRILCPWCLAPSVFFTVVASGIVLLSIPALAGASSHLELDALWALACVATLGGCMGLAAARLGGTRARKVGAISLVCLTFLVALLRDDSGTPNWADGICPLWLNLDQDVGAHRVWVGSLVAWGAAGFVSLGAMLRAVRARAPRTSTRIQRMPA